MGARQTLVALLAIAWSAFVAQGQVTAPAPPSAGDDFHAVGDSPVEARAAGAQSLQAQTLAARDVFRLTNDERAARGLVPLSWSQELCAAAQQHAPLMAASTALSHQYPGERDLATRASQAGAHFSSVAENIALGGSARQISQEWMRSPLHRANILDPRMNALGVAVVVSGGTLYAVEDFAASIPALTPSAVEDKVEAELRSLPMIVAAADGAQTSLRINSRQDARNNCALPDGLLPDSKARFVLRWEGSDLALPEPLRDALRSGRYSAASIGACAASGSANRNFTTYRVAVLLY